MYAKYHTEAIVLGSVPSGEADMRVTLYTREFGLIRARASAARRESSRMRYALQSLSYARVSLIRGGTGWRVAGALALHSCKDAERDAAQSFARVTRLVLRLVGGEEKNVPLFEFLLKAQNVFFSQHTSPALVELICVAHLLHLLGYLSIDALGVASTLETVFAPDTLNDVALRKDMLLISVNRALSETHL